MRDGRRVARRRDAARHRADAGDQLAHAERLHQVVVGAHLEREHPVDLVARALTTMIGTVERARIAAADIGAVQVGQAEVEHDQIGRLVVERRESGRPGALVPHLVRRTGQRVDDAGGDGGVVFDQQDAHGPLSRCAGSTRCDQGPDLGRFLDIRRPGLRRPIRSVE